MRRFLIHAARFLSPLLLLPLLIYLIDPFGLYRENFEYQVIEPNQHFVKMKYLTEQKRDYDSFIWGSSKVGNVDSRKLKNGAFYNMTYSMGLPYEWYHDLKMLLETGYEIKNAVIVLDELSYARTHDQNNSFLRRPYPKKPADRLKFHLSYLFRIPNFKTLYYACYPIHKNKEYRVQYDIKNSGIAFKTSREAYVDANLASHRKDPRFNQPVRIYLVNMEESLSYIQKMRDLCTDHGINFTMLIAPIHHKKLPVLQENRFNEYKARLSAITEYWDFSGPNYITTDNSFWFEQHHFRMHVGDLMIESLNNDESGLDFGRWVTKNAFTDPEVQKQISVLP